jgi:hypothetical protein
MLLWNYTRRGWAERAWAQWYTWAIRSRLTPIKQVATIVSSENSDRSHSRNSGRSGAQATAPERTGTAEGIRGEERDAGHAQATRDSGTAKGRALAKRGRKADGRGRTQRASGRGRAGDHDGR